MKTPFTLVAAALMLCAGTAFAQTPSNPVSVKAGPGQATAPSINSAASVSQPPVHDAKAFPQAKAAILAQIDTRLELLQRDRKCVAAAADEKAVGECKQASLEAQRAAMAKMAHAVNPPAPQGAPKANQPGAAHH